MKIVRNLGSDRMIDRLRDCLRSAKALDIATDALSLPAFAELFPLLRKTKRARLILPSESEDLRLFGSIANRPARNRLRTHRLARNLSEWLKSKGELRRSEGAVPQGIVVLRDPLNGPEQAWLGSLALTTEGLGSRFGVRT